MHCVRIRLAQILCVFATGAYNYSMSSNYNRMPRPAAVMVRAATTDDETGNVAVILERETPADLLRNDRVPAWLQQ